jgi:hypothetical protein
LAVTKAPIGGQMRQFPVCFHKARTASVTGGGIIAGQTVDTHVSYGSLPISLTVLIRLLRSQRP